MLSYRKPDQWWVEPFVGGANVIDKVEGKRIGNDSHYYLIVLLKAVQNGYVPPTNISKEMYNLIKKEPEKYPDELVGFVGFTCSFGGKWWNGYAKNARGENFAEAGSNVLVKQAPKFSGIVFKHGDYKDLDIPANSLIYCDPPYEGTTKYSTNTFDHAKFWDWCREQVKNGHTLFVSEYSAPDDFICVKEVTLPMFLNRNKSVQRIEKLFMYKERIL